MDEETNDDRKSDKSYARYLQRLSETCPQFRAVATFFSSDRENDPLTAPCLRREDKATCWVADSEQGRLQVKEVDVDLLHVVSSSVNVRIVLVHYAYIRTVDLRLLDRVCWSLNVPPDFIAQHLSCDDFRAYFLQKDWGLPNSFRFDISQQRSLEIGDFNRIHASILITSTATTSTHSTAPIILMLIREAVVGISWDMLAVLHWENSHYQPYTVPGPQSAPSLKNREHSDQQHSSLSQYMRYLRGMTEASVLAADRNPIEFAIPFIEMRIREMRWAHQFKMTTSGIKKDSVVEKAGYLGHLQVRESSLNEDFRSIRNTLRYLITNDPSYRSERFRALLFEMDKLKEEDDEYLAQQRDRLQRDIGIMALQESRRSIEEAQSVRNLTQLAYIFIPLTYSASLFGMNVKAMKDSSWTPFIITTLLTVTLSLLSIRVLPAISELWRRSRRWLTCIVFLGKTSPTLAVTLAVFTLLHPRIMVEEVYRDMKFPHAIFEYDPAIRPNKVNKPDLYHEARLPRLRNMEEQESKWKRRWALFWVRRLEKIAELGKAQLWQPDRRP